MGEPQEPSRTGEGTQDSPYKLNGTVDVPEEEGLGVSPAASIIAGNIAGGAVGTLLGMGIRGAKSLASANVVRGGEQLLNKANKLKDGINRAVKTKDSHAEKLLGDELTTTMKAASNGPVPPTINALSSIPGVGPKISKLVQQVGVAPVDKLLSPIWSPSALRNSRRITDNLIKQGFTEKEAILLIQLGNKGAGKGLGKVGGSIGALLGSQGE
jgi:hypothetical protein